MGWRFRKIFTAGPFRTSVTKSGVGYSIGLGGFRYGVTPQGKKYISVGFPGTGFYFQHYLDSPGEANTNPTANKMTDPGNTAKNK